MYHIYNSKYTNLPLYWSICWKIANWALIGGAQCALLWNNFFTSQPSTSSGPQFRVHCKIKQNLGEFSLREMKTEKSGVFEFGEMATFKREARFQGNPMKSCSFKVPTFLGREPNSLHPSTEVEFIIYLVQLIFFLYVLASFRPILKSW